MLPGFRFLFTAIMLSMSLLMFGLGAAALLRAAHGEFASNPSWRAAPEGCSRGRPKPQSLRWRCCASIFRLRIRCRRMRPRPRRPWSKRQSLRHRRNRADRGAEAGGLLRRQRLRRRRPQVESRLPKTLHPAKQCRLCRRRPPTKPGSQRSRPGKPHHRRTTDASIHRVQRPRRSARRHVAATKIAALGGPSVSIDPRRRRRSATQSPIEAPPRSARRRGARRIGAGLRQLARDWRRKPLACRPRSVKHPRRHSPAVARRYPAGPVATGGPSGRPHSAHEPS